MVSPRDDLYCKNELCKVCKLVYHLKSNNGQFSFFVYITVIYIILIASHISCHAMLKKVKLTTYFYHVVSKRAYASCNYF